MLDTQKDFKEQVMKSELAFQLLQQQFQQQSSPTGPFSDITSEEENVNQEV